jgi:hypothetical protein
MPMVQITNVEKPAAVRKVKSRIEVDLSEGQHGITSFRQETSVGRYISVTRYKIVESGKK